MHIYLPVAVFAVISMVYCEAFSAMDNKISTRRASLSSITTTATATTARTIISTDVTLNFRRQQRISTLISAMTTSDENDTITTTTTTTTSLIKAEEEEEEEDTKNENEEKSNIPFDDVAWMAYETMMTKIAMQTRRVKNFNEESVSKCRTYLLSREQYIPSVPDVIENEKSILQSSIRNQAESFRQRFNFTSDEFDFVTRSFVKLGDMSAKNQSKNRNNKNNNVNIDNDNEIDHRLPVAVAWYKLKEMGSIPQENSMSTYMYILSSSNSSSNNNNDD
ncbi:MAG: ribosomal protein L11, partial [Bacillariaceae sp.]